MIVALCGNQNAGKTTLFNLLTGAAEHVGNYPGVTVEQRVGRLLPTYQQGANAVQIVDLPGVYSLTPYSREEAVDGAGTLEEVQGGHRYPRRLQGILISSRSPRTAPCRAVPLPYFNLN